MAPAAAAAIAARVASGISAISVLTARGAVCKRGHQIGILMWIVGIDTWLRVRKVVGAWSEGAMLRDLSRERRVEGTRDVSSGGSKTHTGR